MMVLMHTEEWAIDLCNAATFLCGAYRHLSGCRSVSQVHCIRCAVSVANAYAI